MNCELPMHERIAAIRELSIPECIWQERVKEDAKWGEQNHDDFGWLSILSEEVGEAAQCLNKSYLDPVERAEAMEWRGLLEIELIQIAATAVAWLECIRRRENP